MLRLAFLLALGGLLCSCGTGIFSFSIVPPSAPKTTVAEVPPPAPALEVVGYLPAYKIDTVEPEQIRSLTDIVYFSLAVRLDGRINADALTKPQLEFLHGVQRDYGTRVLIGISDHRMHGSLDRVARSALLRQRLVNSLVSLLDDQGFQGVDFDWEYPTGESRVAFTRLLQDLHEAFEPRGWRLTVALSPSHPLPVAAYDAVDRVHGMLYDDNGQHSTVESAEQHVRVMIAQGIEPAKLLLGVPFYGRGYTKSGPSWSSAVSYKVLRERYQPAPNQDTVSGYYFNGVDTVRRKVAFAREAHLAGVAIWEIGQDTTDGSSLLAAITDASREAPQWN